MQASNAIFEDATMPANGLACCLNATGSVMAFSKIKGHNSVMKCYNNLDEQAKNVIDHFAQALTSGTSDGGEVARDSLFEKHFEEQQELLEQLEAELAAEDSDDEKAAEEAVEGVNAVFCPFFWLSLLLNLKDDVTLYATWVCPVCDRNHNEERKMETHFPQLDGNLMKRRRRWEEKHTKEDMVCLHCNTLLDVGPKFLVENPAPYYVVDDMSQIDTSQFETPAGNKKYKLCAYLARYEYDQEAKKTEERFHYAVRLVEEDDTVMVDFLRQPQVSRDPVRYDPETDTNWVENKEATNLYHIFVLVDA